MKTCYFVAVLVLVIVTRSEVGAEICETCSCEPKEAPVTVTCECKTPETVLDLNPRDFNSKFRNTHTFKVSNCENSIAFKQNLFKDLHNLDNLEIQNVKHVVFEMGVFQKLNHLKLRNIEQLNFKTNAFRGGQMKSVEIHQSNISDIPLYAFHDVDSLEKFVLSDVHIGSAQPNSITLKNNNAVEITNTTIDKIASNAINLEANSVVIFQSSLKMMNPNAINVTAANQFIISQTEFDEDLPDNPIIAMAPVVNISNNIFKRLTPQMIKNFKGSSDGNIIFMGNSINKFESQQPLNVPSSNWNLQGNQFNCSCEMFSLFVNLKNSEILNNNYCKLTKCGVALSKAQDKCARQSPANLDDTDICEGVPTVSPIRPREGRVRGFTSRDDSFTTHMPLVGTTPQSSATVPLASAILLWSFIARIIF